MVTISKLISVLLLIGPIAIIILLPLDQSRSHSGNLSCLGTAEAKQFEVTSQVVLAQDMLEGGNQGDQILQAINQQMKFINVALARMNPKQLLWSSKDYLPPQIKILKTESTLYPIEVLIDPPPFLKSTADSYLQKALKKNKITRGEKALRITYQASLNLYLCSKENTRAQNLLVVLPLDPYLAYWSVPKNRREQIHWREYSQFTNPCVDAEYVSENDPEEMWYYWHPLAQTAVCQELVNGPLVVSAELKPQKSLEVAKDIRFDELKKTAELRISIFVGHYTFDQTDNFNLELIKKSADTFLQQTDFESAKAHLPYSNNIHLPALNTFLITVWSAERAMKEVTRDVQYNSFGVEVILQGKLKKSGHSTKLRIYLAAPKGPGREYFLSAFGQAIQRDQIILYSGHSGAGRHFSPDSFTEEILRLTEKPILKDPLTYQVIGLFSCYSLLYFPPEGFPSPQLVAKNFHRDMIYTAAAQNDIAGKALLGIIDNFDRALSSNTPFSLNNFLKEIDLDSFFVVL